ncbi:hypothetical protein RirG_233080 [Rhizophagus irregularis DAOM 197198w]|uniref:BTB domain-containing protein n=1 Tax=Rhizophagus irregularis (strain DAOM 197198w) TaxID=1432141 RepID=A0A015JI45_RHIIW|nr:hypothetical protein RirG_233080 [Rhizophagus irregularis DAOM 197198w]
MDGNKLLRKLSQNLLEVLDDGEYYDIIIKVGDVEPYVKIFRAHMAILNYRSPYLREILFENKMKNYDGTLVRIELPNILPEIFQVILRYIYGGKISLKNYDILYLIKILIAANELSIKELVIYIQLFLIHNRANWLEQNFYLIYQTIFENDSFLELQNYCNNLMSKNPNKIFESLDFPSIPEKIFISIIQNDNLQMNVVQIWENVLKWGLAQNPELSSDPSSYSKDDFNNLRNTLEQCIPFIRFYDLTSKEFSDNILPYRKIIPEELYMDLLKSFLNLHPDSKLNNISKSQEINPSQHNINKSIEIFNHVPFNRSNKRRVRRNRQRLKKIFSQIKIINERKKPINYSSWDRVVLVRDTWNTEEHLKNTWEKPTKAAWDYTLEGSAGGWGETPVVPQSAGGWNEDPVAPQYTDGWDDEPVAPQSAGGWNEEPVAPQYTGGWDAPVAPQSAGGWNEEPVAPQSAGGWDEEPVAPQSAGGWD